ncbi:MAG: OmpR family two-component response regulator [Gemmatimonadetes bacterium]|nr:OmpR family two-component response regulator [Gemmatimonadota bacterium]
MRILVAEDDTLLARSLVKGLRERTHAVDHVADGESAVIQGVLHEYDAIILDVMLPGRDGFDVARALRARDVRAPILMLTARDRLGDKVEGLDAGADDYLTKPFEFEELLARLRALHRRQPAMSPQVITVGDLTVDTRSQVATRAGRPLPLTSKEYAMLEFLAHRAGAVVSRADISAHVWDGNHDPFSNTLEVCLGRLRRKVDEGGARPLIHTRRRAGYMLADLGTSTAGEPPFDADEE